MRAFRDNRPGLTYRHGFDPRRRNQEERDDQWYISPFGHPQARFDHLASLTNCRITGGYLRIPCPAHGGTDPNLSLWVNDDGIAARCHSAGCSYADIAMAILARYGISIGPGLRQDHAKPVIVCPRDSKRTPSASSTSRNLRPYALQLWHRSISFPNPPDHPARQWLAARQLWRPELPLPWSVRWIGTEHLHREFQGAGAVIAMAAPPDAWTTSWPSQPEPSCVQLVYVAGDGTPAVERGLTKRTYASATDAVVVLGCPLLEQTSAPVDVAEGLADVIALAARSPAPAVATLGTSGMASAIIAKWLATSPATQVWADRDMAKNGRAPPGQRHGRELVRMVNDAGGNAVALHAPFPHKDPAAAAAAMGFNDADPTWPDYARTLSETTDWPRWECARQAVAQCAEEV